MEIHRHRMNIKIVFPICLIILCLQIAEGSQAQISEFCPDCGEYEYVLVNINSTYCKNAVLTDEEGQINLSNLDGEVYIAKNSSAFFEKFGFYPDVVAKGRFRLSNSGETILLYCNGKVSDSVTYCDYNLSYCDKDVVYFRNQKSKNEWDFRYIEWTSFEPVTDFVSGKIIITPADYRFNPNESLVLVSYTLTEPLNLRELDERVKITLILAANPVGGIPLEEIQIIDSLKNAEVFFLNSEYYKNFHYKFAIEDGKKVWISTENWKKSNRGFIVVFESEKIANHLLKLVNHDLKFSDHHGKVSDIGEGKSGISFSNPIDFEGNVTLYILPDANLYGNPIFDLISSSENELLIEVPYLSLNWFGSDKTFELLRNACKNSSVKILLDSKYSKNRNKEVENFLNKLAGKDCNISVKLIPLRNFNSLHGKMIYSDGKCIITSANFNEYGLKLNREVAVLMDGNACDILRDQFYKDWSDRFSIVSSDSISFVHALSVMVAVFIWKNLKHFRKS